MAPEPTAAPTLPDLDEGPDELVFDVFDWRPEDRVILGLNLTDREIPWRWEPGPELVVRAGDEAAVEEVMDGESVDLPGLNDDDEDDDGDEDSGDDDASAEGDAEPADQSTLSDMFDAADRLVRNGANAEALATVDRLSEVIEESAPPFGVEESAWDDIGRLADRVSVAGDAEDDEAVTIAARTLRDFLRDYV